ncbi:hypothetical protein MAR_031728 [Mya arenaria]|uniref:Uncharacterized protein n=1 Tax=Mya arenaria TaxID=6604 RepID=A0ABY7F8N3_MYAAR|nr:hypothetical protein MAR_031728 [Mya arenaria]
MLIFTVAEMSTDQQKDERPSANNEAESMTHTGAMALVKKELTDIIKSDPLLCDLPPEITLDEINSQVALESCRYPECHCVGPETRHQATLSASPVQDRGDHSAELEVHMEKTLVVL